MQEVEFIVCFCSSHCEGPEEVYECQKIAAFVAAYHRALQIYWLISGIVLTFKQLGN